MRAALCLFILLSGCSTERDDHDADLENRLDLRLSELTSIGADQMSRRKENLMLREAQARWKPISEAELVTLAGTTAKVEWGDEIFYAAAFVNSAGSKHEGVEFVTQILSLGPAHRLAQFALTETRWSARFTVILGSPKKPSTLESEPLAPRGSFCLSSCRERRERIVQKQARLVLLAQGLGDLAELSELKRELWLREQVGSKLPAPEWGEVLSRLDRAASFDDGTQLSLSRDEGQISGVGAPQRETLQKFCELEPQLFQACSWKADRLELKLVTKRAP